MRNNSFFNFVFFLFHIYELLRNYSALFRSGNKMKAKKGKKKKCVARSFLANDFPSVFVSIQRTTECDTIALILIQFTERFPLRCGTEASQNMHRVPNTHTHTSEQRQRRHGALTHACSRNALCQPTVCSAAGSFSFCEAKLASPQRCTIS